MSYATTPITDEIVADRPATVSWDSTLLAAVPDEAGRREIIRLIGLEEGPDETRDFDICYPFQHVDRGWDWLRCLSSFTAQTGAKHFALTYQKNERVEVFDAEEFFWWAAEVGRCEPELNDRRVGQYRRWKEQRKEDKK